MRAKRRCALVSMILISAVLLLPVQPAGASPRRGGVERREGVRSSIGILGHWEHLMWSFLVSVLEKGANAANPDGAMISDDGH